MRRLFRNNRGDDNYAEVGGYLHEARKIYSGYLTGRWTKNESEFDLDFKKAIDWIDGKNLTLYVFIQKQKYYFGYWIYKWIITDNVIDKVIAQGQLSRSDGSDGGSKVFEVQNAAILKPYRGHGLYTRVLIEFRERYGIPVWSDTKRTGSANFAWQKLSKLGRARYDSSKDRWIMKNPKRRRRNPSSKNFRRERYWNSKKRGGSADKRSFRTKKLKRGGRALFACPKGHWSPKSKRCKSAMKLYELLVPRSRRRSRSKR